MKITDLFEAKPTKLTAADKKLVAARVKEAKQSDGKIKFADLKAAEYAAEDEEYGSTNHFVCQAIYKELSAWSEENRLAYKRLEKDVTALEEKDRNLYLFDNSVDNENVLNSVRTEDSVDYWESMCSAAGSAVGERAHAVGIDINKVLGRMVW